MPFAAGVKLLGVRTATPSDSAEPRGGAIRGGVPATCCSIM